MLSLLCLLLVNLAAFARADNYGYVGCYAISDVSFNFKNTYPSNPYLQCSSLCSAFQYVALLNGNDCYCGDMAPSGTAVANSNCNTNCTDTANSCGGFLYFAVYSDSSKSLSSSSTTTLSSTSSSILSSITDMSSTTSSTSTLSSILLTNNLTSYTPTSISSNTTSSKLNLTSTLSHSHSSATTSSEITVITSNSEYIQDGVTLTSAVLLTRANADIEITKVNNNVVSSSVTVVHSHEANIKNQVAGGVVGASAGVTCIAAFVWYYTRRVRQKDEQEKQRHFATIAATLGKSDLSHSGTLYGKADMNSNINSAAGSSAASFMDVGGGLSNSSSTKSKPLLPIHVDPRDAIRMGSTGRDSTFLGGGGGSLRGGYTGALAGAVVASQYTGSSNSDSLGGSTLGSFRSGSTDDYYNEKLAQFNNQEEVDLNRNVSNASGYSFASFDSNNMIVETEDEHEAEYGDHQWEEEDDNGSIQEYPVGSSAGLTIANPDEEDITRQSKRHSKPFF